MNKVYGIITEQITNKLKEGVVPWRKTWAYTGEDGGPINFVTKTRYHGINVVLLGMQGFERPFWATRKQIESIGGVIRPDEMEKGSFVVYWKQYETEDEDEDGNIQVKVRRVLRYSKAFNVDQCDGVPEGRVPVIEERDLMDRLPRCERLIEGYEGKPSISHAKYMAYYAFVDDYVNVPPAECFESGDSYYHTLFHELVHSTGHPDRLGRFGPETGRFGSETYSREELVAEMGACFLANTAGIAMDVDNSAAYIGSWLEKLGDNPKWVVQAAGRADKAVAWIKGQRPAVEVAVGVAVPV